MDAREISSRALKLDDLAHADADGVQFWLAREIMPIMGYDRWENFDTAVKRAVVSIESTDMPGEHHFREVTKMVGIGSGGKRAIKDYKLTRYACYLIAMNGDPRKEEIAFAQSYFALETRKQELIEQRMAELQRLQERSALSEAEKHLSAVAFERGVDGRGFAMIKSRGDKALFGGSDTRAMKRRLGVPDKKPLADALPSVTIAAKNFAATMTAHNVESKDLNGAPDIGNEHIENNLGVRRTLTSRGIYPEDLPAEEDVRKLERRVKADERKLKGRIPGFKGDADRD